MFDRAQFRDVLPLGGESLSIQSYSLCTFISLEPASQCRIHHLGRMKRDDKSVSLKLRMCSIVCIRLQFKAIFRRSAGFGPPEYSPVESFLVVTGGSPWKQIKENQRINAA